MHVSSDKYLVEIKCRDSVLSVGWIFPIKEAHPWRRIYLLQDCVVGSEVSECVKRPIHTSDNTRPQGKLREEKGGLEGRGEGLREAFGYL